MNQQPSKSVGYLGLLQSNPDFRRLWLGALVSFTGDWFNTIALYTAVQELFPSGKAIAGVMVAKMLPGFLVTPIVGRLVDHYDRKRLLIISDIIRAVCTLGLVASYLYRSPVGLYSFTVIMMMCTGLTFSSKSAIIPMIVAKRNIVIANALNGGTWSAMLAIGAALGGLATEQLGIVAAFVIDGLTFLLAMLLHMGLPTLRPSNSSGEKTHFVQALRYLRSNKNVLSLTLLKPMLGLFGGIVVLIPIFGINTFEAYSGALCVGLLYASRGMGAFLGSLGLPRLFRDDPRGLKKLVLGGLILASLSFALMGASHNIWLVGVFYFSSAVGTSCVWVSSGSLIHLEADHSFHGRIFAIDFGMMTLLMATTSAITGVALDAGYTPYNIAHACSVIGICAAITWAFVIFRSRSGEHPLEATG